MYRFKKRKEDRTSPLIKLIDPPKTNDIPLGISIPSLHIIQTLNEKIFPDLRPKEDEYMHSGLKVEMKKGLTLQYVDLEHLQSYTRANPLI